MVDYTIDPTQLNATGSTFVNDLLATIVEESHSPYIKAGIYTLEFSNKTLQVELTRSLLKRARESNSKQSRIEVLSAHTLASGGFSDLHDSLGVLIPEEQYRFKQKSEETSRVCKRIPFSEISTQDQINNESSYTKMNKLLHSKSAVFDELGGFIVMRKIDGMELYDLLNKVESKKIHLTVGDRFKLTYTILKAYKEQVFDNSIVHRDLKPENVLINLKQMLSVIIDYGIAIQSKGDETKCPFRGTYDFLAPETVLRDVASFQTDMYSLGLVLAQIWGDTSSFKLCSLNREVTAQELMQNIAQRTWTDLFKDFFLSSGFKYEITTFFDSLSNIKSDHRLGIIAAMSKWEQIMNNYFESEQQNSLDAEDETPPLSEEETISSLVW